ncbi:uncharacterized protein F5Z01DRAFT_676989 [Emericellopsis atlantica]|uniref:Uncharacterized protein n=1 Tax=Emericellopsis atlantica TaxID=2614577 RepID=A0A9P7ZGH8_9HYPO|nr:uncharacterized protein F5Z01DRAFT_676989 [Emericellopsis atlantica]KAG9251237.1 hypothetical protein F5Z01DRAFT_676989 [Emericellopsis atlantica]
MGKGHHTTSAPPSKHTVTRVIGHIETQTATLTHHYSHGNSILPRRSISKRSDITQLLLQDLDDVCQDANRFYDEDSDMDDDSEFGGRSFVKAQGDPPKLTGESLAKYFGHEWDKDDEEKDKKLWDTIATDVYNWACTDPEDDISDQDTDGLDAPGSKSTGTSQPHYNMTDSFNLTHAGGHGEKSSTTETAVIATKSPFGKSTDNVAAMSMGNVPLALAAFLLLVAFGM